MAGYIGSKAVSVNTTSATISDDLAVGDDATITGDLDVDGTTNLDVVDIDGAVNIAAATTIATNNKIQFRDTAIHISSPADGDLAIAADDEIDITSTLIDVNGNLDVSGTTVSAGKITGGTGTGRKLFLGDYTSTSSGSPSSLSLGARFSDTAGEASSIKLHIYENKLDNTAADYTTMGIGVSSNQMDFIGSETGFVHAFWTGGTERLTVQSTAGNNVVVADGLTLTNGNLTVATDHGIAFGAATGNNDRGSTANTLSDYETGTWLPAAVSGTLSVNYARYVRVGNVVHIQAYLSSISPESSSTSQFQISGLPFTAGDAGNSYGAISISYWGDMDIAVPNLISISQGVYLYMQRNDGNTASVSNQTFHSAGSSRALIFGGTYITSQ